jgi:hypothetical protein
MRTLKEQHPIVLVFAIIGICAVLYFIFQGYQHYAAEQQQRAALFGPPSGAVGQALKATPQPPPQ